MLRPIKSMIRDGPMKTLNQRRNSDNHQYQSKEVDNLAETTH